MSDRVVRLRKRQSIRRLHRATLCVVLAGVVLLSASARGGLGLDDIPYILSVSGATLFLALLLEWSAASVMPAPGRARVLCYLASLLIWGCAAVGVVLSVYTTAEVIGTPRCAPGTTDTSGSFLPSCIEHPISDRLDILFVDGMTVLLILAGSTSLWALRPLRTPALAEDNQVEPEATLPPAVSLESIHAAAVTARLQKSGSFSTWRDQGP